MRFDNARYCKLVTKGLTKNVGQNFIRSQFRDLEIIESIQ